MYALKIIFCQNTLCVTVVNNDNDYSKIMIRIIKLNCWCSLGFLAFLKQMEWVRAQWATAQAEAVRLQTELDDALRKLEKWEAKFSHVRKLLDGEKRERNIVLKKYSELVSTAIQMKYDLAFCIAWREN